MFLQNCLRVPGYPKISNFEYPVHEITENAQPEQGSTVNISQNVFIVDPVIFYALIYCKTKLPTIVFIRKLSIKTMKFIKLKLYKNTGDTGTSLMQSFNCIFHRSVSDDLINGIIIILPIIIEYVSSSPCFINLYNILDVCKMFWFRRFFPRNFAYRQVEM